MISAITGEVSFEDALVIQPFCTVRKLLERVEEVRRASAVGWTSFALGSHRSAHGLFETKVICDRPGRVHAVLLAHDHAFYSQDTPEDTDRRAFHEGVIIAELKGQREFAWGEVLCQFSHRTHKNWLVVVYIQELPVPQRPASVLGELFAHEQPLGSSSSESPEESASNHGRVLRSCTADGWSR